MIKEQLLIFNFWLSSSYLQATSEEAKGSTFPYKNIVKYPSKGLKFTRDGFAETYYVWWTHEMTQELFEMLNFQKL